MPTLTKTFEISPRVVLHLGERLVRDDLMAFGELVKNAYDASASTLTIRFERDGTYTSGIVFSDDGIGMDTDDLTSRFLVIATDGKVKNPRMGGRVVSGEKGIGRLSSARLGGVLELASRKMSCAPIYLRIDWDQFQSAPDVASYPITILTGSDAEAAAGILLPSGSTGTTLRITRLRSQWDCAVGSGQIEKLYDALAEQFHLPQQNDSFCIQIHGHAEVTSPDDEGIVVATLSGTMGGDGKADLCYKNPARGISRIISGPRAEIGVSGCGPFTCELQGRRLPLSSQEYGIAEKIWRDAPLDLTIYRDGVLSSSPREDTPRGEVSSPYRITGKVFITSRDNPGLISNTARDGFVGNLPTLQFEAAIKALVSILVQEIRMDDTRVEDGSTSKSPRGGIIEILENASSVLRRSAEILEQAHSATGSDAS